MGEVHPSTGHVLSTSRTEPSGGENRGVAAPATRETQSETVLTEKTHPRQPVSPDISPPETSTHPLFPPLPEYSPPSPLRNAQWLILRAVAFILSLAFLAVIVVAALVTSCAQIVKRRWVRLKGQDPDANRPFREEEARRGQLRKDDAKSWENKKRRREAPSELDREERSVGIEETFEPPEGGKDRLLCDIGYYARRVGLDAESYDVQTEDGFILTLCHIYNPKERRKSETDEKAQPRKYPVLMMPGLLQGAGTYCVNDDDSLAFYLCKSGYDVWLGQNRCGFKPRHATLSPSDPRFWSWNIRHMGIYDLPALVTSVLSRTKFPKLALVAHSQGTTQTLVSLAKNQRPDLGGRISVFCALAPAAYAGPLISKPYLKFIRLYPPAVFKAIFGIHGFIPFMMTMHKILPSRLFGQLGYLVFSYLFTWTDTRWDRGLRNRMFMFSPVYVSAECMRWWLGRDGFATQKCILATRDDWRREDMEDRLVESNSEDHHMATRDRGLAAWYDERAPPFALWIAGSDDLVDGRRLLKRLSNGREPGVRVVHAKVIEGYEHLDVLWAMDAVKQVGKEVRDVIWRCVDEGIREECVRPVGIRA